MSRWNIKHILFFSKDGRRRDIDLAVGRVNVITGDSHTGKSGLAEVIDYALGSSECHIPGIIREATSWVGILWVREDTECLMCRRMPGEAELASSDYSITIGNKLVIPESFEKLTGKATRNAALKKFEQLLGIGVIEPEGLSGIPKTTNRISLRHVLPYLLQDDEHIISKINLLRGAGGDPRQSIIDTLPYVLGVEDEASYAEHAYLTRLRAQLEATAKRSESKKRLTDRDTLTAQMLVEECRQVGLLPAEATGATEPMDLLRALPRETNQAEVLSDDRPLNALYDEQRSLQHRASGLRSRADEMRRAMRAYDGYITATAGQRQRLEVVDLIPTDDRLDSCPLCAQSVKNENQTIERVRAAFTTVKGELLGVERERPKLDGVFRDLEQQATEVTGRLSEIRRLIAALIQERASTRDSYEVSKRQDRVLGRISLFLEAIEESLTPETDSTGRLRAQIAELEEHLNAEARQEELDSVKSRLLEFARALVHELPLEERYRDSPIDFNPRTLGVGIATAKRRVSMRDVGSDENYLTLHVALLLAFHRLFAERDRPVPGFLLFDQLSRPYYPPEMEKEQVAVVPSPERSSLLRYFDVLFHEVERAEGLQILILEKAYFSGHPEYVAATVERWNGGKKLIPEDWPEYFPER
jgi:hypothetical protein